MARQQSLTTFSRRSFLGVAVASLGPTLYFPRMHAGSANERLNLGFIGVGTMGRGHLSNFAARSGVQVVAVCDVVAERRQNALNIVEKRGGKGCQEFVDFRKLLELKDLDAVVIATPDHWHAIPCILAARAGKHIYCEKPLTHHLAEGRVLVDEVRKAGIVFQTGSQQRSEFSGYFRQAVDYIRNGRIGKVKTIRIGVGGPAVACTLPTQEVPQGTDWDLWVGPASFRLYHEELCPKGVHSHFPAWRRYKEYGGGGLADMGAHHFDIAQWAMDMDGSGPVSIVPPSDPKSGSGLKFVYASGIEMIHGGKHACTFEGSEGVIHVDRNAIQSEPGEILKQKLTDTDKRVYLATDHRGNWLDCIHTKKGTICTAEIGHRSASICHLGNIGYWLGRPLKWDPAKEKFVGDAEADKLLVREYRAPWKV